VDLTKASPPQSREEENRYEKVSYQNMKKQLDSGKPAKKATKCNWGWDSRESRSVHREVLRCRLWCALIGGVVMNLLRLFSCS
jgi:hypothetical protein